MREIRLFEAFAGYGSQLMALRRLEKAFPDEIKIVPVGISEIDPHAIKAYQAVHGDVTNYGDISKIDWSQVPDFDLFTYSSPCQSFSNAGRQEGGEEGSGTRSSLLWECRKATDIFTNHPNPELREPCKNGDKCHQAAPRGTRKGLQAIKRKELRSAYPTELCRHIVDICERYFDSEPLQWSICDNNDNTQLKLF